MQVGDIWVHWAGKSHNKYYGFPHWAHDDVVAHVKRWVCVASTPPPPPPEEEKVDLANASYELVATSTFCRDGEKHRTGFPTIEECSGHVAAGFPDAQGFMYSDNMNCDPCFSMDTTNFGPFGPDSVYQFNTGAVEPAVYTPPYT